MPQKRSRQLKPLSSEHHQALLVAFQLRKGLEGHGDSAGAPKDLPGLQALARRFEESTFLTHTRAEEELLQERFGEAFSAYQWRVPAYLPLPARRSPVRS